MPAPVGFIPDNAPEGFTLDEEQPKQVAPEDALKFGVNFSSSFPSTLSRLLQSGGEGSEMGRDQAAKARESDREALSGFGIGTQPLSAGAMLSGIQAIPGLMGKVVAGAGRTIRDVLSPSTYLPEEEQPRPFIISPRGIGKMTPEEAELREPLTAGRPLFPVPRTQLQPEGTDFGKQIEALTTPESIAMIAAGEIAPKVGLGLLATMVPGIADDVKAVVDSEVSPQEKRDRINGLIVPAVLGINSMRQRGAIPEIEKGPPNALQIGKPATLPLEVPPGSGEALGQGVPAPRQTPVPQGAETPVQAKAQDVVPAEAAPTPAPETPAVPTPVPEAVPEAAPKPESPPVPPLPTAVATQTTAPPAPEVSALTPKDLRPALMVDGKPVVGNNPVEGGHPDILRDAAKNPELLPKLPGMIEAFADDSKHVFVDKSGKVYTRDEAAVALGEKKPLDSTRLRELQKEKPATPEAVPTETKPPESETILPESRTKSGVSETIKPSDETGNVNETVPPPEPPKFSASMYRGRGAKPEDVYGSEAVAEGRAVPILGQGDYFAFNPEDAKTYGKVTQHQVELRNPIEIDSDSAWYSLLKDANALALHSRGSEFSRYPERIKPATKRLQDYLRSKGYDGAIIRVPDGDVNARGEVAKSLAESFGHSQVVKFQEPPTKAIRQTEAFANSPTAEIGPGEETGAEMAHGTASGLPPSVPDRGPGFSAELLEASRQLGTLVRSRVTLAKGVLGQYVRARSAIGQNDRIEVGDIRNQLTVAHEMGHDLDALIWPKTNLARSIRSLEERVPGTSGKDLQNELIPVSELMRGPITGTKGHQAYRKSAVELIADFFALYAHDPETARKMAPKFSEGFEKQLATKPDAAGVIHQLLEGNVEPVPAEQTASGPAATPTATPGKVLARLFPDPVKRDLPAAIAAQDLVKGTVREFESRVQRARVTADQWRESVPNRTERSDVGAFVEGIGNVEIPGDTIDSVKDRMTPAMRLLAKTYRFAIEAQRNDINAYLKGAEQGEYLKFLEDYLPHFYANSSSGTVRTALGKFIKESPNAKARKLPTVREAIDLGLIPITQDPAVLYEHHANINWRVATNRQLMHTLKDMQLSTGEPAVVPAKDAPPGWVITQNPLVQKVYARQTPNGVMIWKGGAAIHPDVWHAVRQILEQPVSSDLGKLYDSLNGLTRANAFAFSMFHDLTLRAASLGSMMGANPFRGLFRLFERNPTTGELEAFRSTRGVGKDLLKDEEAVADAAKHGLKFAWTESESYQHNARDFLENMAAKWRDVPYLGKSVAMARDLQQIRQEGLWKNTHDAFKIVAYNDAVSKALADAPKGTNPSVVKEQIASRLNDAFGGQEWQTKFWMSPQIRRTMSRFFLAPDWTTSTLRSVPGVSDAASVIRTQSPRLIGREPGVANLEGVGGNLGRGRFWAGELAALAGATLATQYAIYSAFGDPNKGDKPWVWDNESGQRRRIDITPIMRQLPWRDPKDPTRYYVNLGKRPEEVLAWVIHPEANIMSKMARPVAEVFRQITGMEGDFKQPWKQDHETFVESLPERAKSVAKEFVPFVFAGNQFALSVPFRKGMTKSKAQDAYESVYELAVNPNRLRSLMRGQQPSEGSLNSMVSEITDAATRNGVPAEEVRRRALSEVRGHHYALYFKALKNDDKAGMEKEANAIIRLGGTQRGMQESLINREKLEPRLPQ